MSKKITLHAALFTLAMAGTSLAQTAANPNDVQLPPIIAGPQQRIEQISGITHALSGAAEVPLGAARLTPALLADIVTWLAANFDLPAIYDYPRVELVTRTKLATIRYRGLLSDLQPRAAADDGKTASPDQGPTLWQSTMAVYVDARRTIYLPEGWSGATPAELSVVVHEMVHHLQSLGGVKYECLQEREKLAYAAQERWLALFGRNLMDEFEIDPFTILIRSSCQF